MVPTVTIRPVWVILAAGFDGFDGFAGFAAPAWGAPIAPSTTGGSGQWTATVLRPSTGSTSLTKPGRTIIRDGGFSTPTAQPGAAPLWFFDDTSLNDANGECFVVNGSASTLQSFRVSHPTSPRWHRTALYIGTGDGEISVSEISNGEVAMGYLEAGDLSSVP